MIKYKTDIFIRLVWVQTQNLPTIKNNTSESTTHSNQNICNIFSASKSNLDRLEDREGPSLDLDRDRVLRLSRDRLRDLDLLRRGDRDRERDRDLERRLREI